MICGVIAPGVTGLFYQKQKAETTVAEPCAILFCIVSHYLQIFSVIFQVTYFMLRFSSAFHYKAMDFTMSMVMDKAGNVGRG